jgi:transcription elongation factor GreA
MIEHRHPYSGRGATRPPSTRLSMNHTYLTEDGRELLEERIRLLERTVGELRDALDDPECRVDSVEGFHLATQELARLRALVDESARVEDFEDDPEVVKLGDAVTIRFEDGHEERYVLVHAAEAPVGDERVSVDAPLGRALLAKGVGETIEVTAPTGSYRCSIVSSARPRA